MHGKELTTVTLITVICFVACQEYFSGLENGDMETEMEVDKRVRPRTSHYSMLKQHRTDFKGLPEEFWRRLGGGYPDLMQQTGRSAARRKMKGKRLSEDTMTMYPFTENEQYEVDK